MMDHLPELHSDTEIDALMHRLGARLGRPELAAPVSAPAADPNGDPLHDFLAAQEDFGATMVRALRVLTEALEEVDAEVPSPLPEAEAPRAPASSRQTVRARTRKPAPQSRTTRARRSKRS